MEVDSGSSHFGRWSVSRRESGGLSPNRGRSRRWHCHTKSATDSICRRARMESQRVGRGRRPRRPATAIKRKSRCGAVAGGRGRPPLPVGTLRAGFAVKCERMRPFARRGNESTSNGIEANVFPFLRVMRRVTDASVEEVALEANVMCL